MYHTGPIDCVRGTIPYRVGEALHIKNWTPGHSLKVTVGTPMYRTDSGDILYRASSEIQKDRR